jgi:hypothetical protein
MDIPSLGDAEGILLKSCLIDKNAQNGIISIHRLMQAAVISNQTDFEKERYLKAVICVLSWSFPDTWSEDVGHQFQAWSKCEKCLPHVHYLIAQQRKYKIGLSNPQQYGELLLRCSW